MSIQKRLIFAAMMFFVSSTAVGDLLSEFGTSKFIAIAGQGVFFGIGIGLLFATLVLRKYLPKK